MLFDLLILASTLAPLSDVTSLGAAGIVGAVYLLERKLSLKRERQLDKTFTRIERQDDSIEELVRVIRVNTQAVTLFSERLEQFTRQKPDA